MAPESKLKVSQDNNVLSSSSSHSVDIELSSFKPLIGMGKETMTLNAKEVVKINDWGFPGFLTDDEYDVFEKFRQEVYRRDNRFKQTVFSFAKAQEDEAYALCRWLRARKFKYDQVIDMVTKASELRDEPASYDFFPDPNDALGVEASVYLSQYPHMYYSYAKNDCPLFISRPGVLNVSGLECITSVEGILNYHWHDMMYNYMGRLNERYQMTEGRFKRYEVVLVIDLKHLTGAQLNKRALNIIKIQTEIDSLCFPETLNRMIIINAPSFFTYTFKLIKNWVDVRTSNKVEMFNCNEAKWKKRLKELVEDHNLPLDYGGTGMTTKQYIEDKLLRSPQSNLSHQKSHLMRVRGSAHWNFTLQKGQTANISIFTRSSTKTTFHVIGPNGKEFTPKSGIEIRNKETTNGDKKPIRVEIRDTLLPIKGPGTFKVRAESFGSGVFSSNIFLIVAWVRDEHENNSNSMSSSQTNDAVMKKSQNMWISSSNPVDRVSVHSQSIRCYHHHETDTSKTDNDLDSMGEEELMDVPLSASESETKSIQALDENIPIISTQIDEEDIINVYSSKKLKNVVVVEEEIPSTGFLCGESMCSGAAIPSMFSSCLPPREK